MWLREVLVGTHVQPLLWDMRVGSVGWRAGAVPGALGGAGHVREAWFPGGDRKRALSLGKVLQGLLLLPGPVDWVLEEGPEGLRATWSVGLGANMAMDAPAWLRLC